MTEIAERKSSHLSLCATEDVEHHGATLLDEVRLMHEALPDLSLDEVDLETVLFGKTLRAPLVISGMTGGTDEAGRLNRALAAAAQKLGVAMGVGSQRAMLLHPEQADSYRVRDVAPDILLFANLGAVQARESGPAAVAALVRAIGADALCVHLNVAQELVQDEGDRDFRGCLAALAELANRLPVPVIVKETGCGFAPGTLARLRDAGLEWVDVSGAGGTSWTAVESLRGSARQKALGAELREWGIPTAAAVVYASRAGLRVIASGGIRGAGDAAAALALGADAVSLALPFFRAFTEGEQAGVLTAGERLIEGLRVVALLTGARDARALRRVPRVIGPELARWIEGEK
ncbi:MAG TPA: type 2 isopentenyl-diphosphate Delta-isomerase [Myxococcota bacterium]|nr:type 2 isopentenyl-diphosphate Delta-isomerase [Myxococcota bacterium]